MRRDPRLAKGERQNALWGRRGENRGNALWGSGKRRMVLLAVAATLVVPVAGSAAPRSASSRSGAPDQTLLQLAAANPDKVFEVIVQTRGSAGKGRAADAIASALRTPSRQGARAQEAVHGDERRRCRVDRRADRRPRGAQGR